MRARNPRHPAPTDNTPPDASSTALADGSGTQPAGPADAADGADGADGADAADGGAPAADELPLTRRERRAAARGGGAAGKVPSQRGVRLPPPPMKHRDYAARKHG